MSDENANDSNCPGRHRLMPAGDQLTDPAFIPFKKIEPHDRVAFYGRGMTMVSIMKAHLAFDRRRRQRHLRPGEVYLDSDWIPTKPRRPAFKRMLDDARGRKFDVLAVPDATRISRRPAEVARVVGELRELGIRIALMGGGSVGSSRGIGLSRPRIAFPGIHNCI